MTENSNALILASQSSNAQAVDQLLSSGAVVNEKDSEGNTALIEAAFNGSLDVVELLLEHGADPNLSNDKGGTAIIYAAWNGYTDAVEALIKQGIDIRHKDKEGTDALMCATFNGHLKVASILLKNGANINTSNFDGNTPLIAAAYGGYVDIVKMLLDNGAYITPMNHEGCTAMGAGSAHPDVMATLVKGGADLEIEIKHLDEIGRIKHKNTERERQVSTSKGLIKPQLDDNSKRNASRLAALSNELNCLIGLTNVKADVAQLINFLRVQQMRKDKGLSIPEQSLHMVFTGNPGTGKTTIARLLAEIYKSLGMLTKGHFIETDRSDLVAAYLGQTALKVQEVVKSAIGGVLFIDEAYSLTESKQDSYGQEAINTLLKLMEDNRGNLIVITAGYTEPMQQFIRSNPGLQSRFNKFLHFDDYSPAELTEIFIRFAQQGDYKLTSEAVAKLDTIFASLYEKRDERFGNARDARNLFEKAINNHANRMITVAAMDETSLVTLQPEDIPAS